MNTLKRGMSGHDVSNLKNHLQTAGLITTDSDLFDLQTEAGVRTAQEMLRLEKDGIVGPRTWGELLGQPRLFDSPVNPIKWVKPTPYHPQRDNEYHPSGTCNVTALAMVLAYHGVTSFEARQLEDELFLELQKPEAIAEFNKNYPTLKKMGYKPRHVHGMLGWLTRRYGFNWKYSESTSRQEMIAHGRTIGPMIISGRFTPAGHIITLVGMTYLDDLIVHDPWGDWNTGYRNHDGQYRIYNREAMEDVLSGHSSSLKRVHRISPV